MKFWEAMKEMQDHKNIRCKNWDQGHYLSYGRLSTHPYNVFTFSEDSKFKFQQYFKHEDIDAEWEIYQEPELYYQWRVDSGALVGQGRLLTGEECAEVPKGKNLVASQKHAGPWVKTAYGFEKTKDWKQF